MAQEDLAAPLEGATVDELADWASLWADLLHVDMTLLARRNVPIDAANLFVRRALWEAAAVSYGRTANTGRRRQRLESLVSEDGVDAERCHRDVIGWRNQHVAHRVDHLRERVEVGAVVDPAKGSVRRLNVRVMPALGPEDEADDLVQRLEVHVKRLRDRVWSQHFPSLEQDVIAAYRGRGGELIARAQPLKPAAGFAIDIDPSGRS